MEIGNWQVLVCAAIESSNLGSQGKLNSKIQTFQSISGQQLNSPFAPIGLVPLPDRGQPYPPLQSPVLIAYEVFVEFHE